MRSAKKKETGLNASLVQKWHLQNANLINESAAKLRADIPSLVVIYDAYRAAADAFLGIANQERADEADLPDTWWEAMNGLAEDVAETLYATVPRDKNEAELRAKTIIDSHLRGGHSLAEVAALAAQAAAEAPKQ